jgi:flagellar biosynthesis/type III secretory pathway protein FliH
MSGHKLEADQERMREALKAAFEEGYSSGQEAGRQIVRNSCCYQAEYYWERSQAKLVALSPTPRQA